MTIYQVFWLYRTNKELKAQGQQVWPFITLLLPLFLVVVVAIVVAGADASQLNSGSNHVADIVGVLSIVLAFVATFVIVLRWMYKYCKAVAAVTNNELTLAFNYALWIITSIIGVNFIWPFIVQNSLNKLGAPSGTVPIS